jgi:hypothetical protein
MHRRVTLTGAGLALVAAVTIVIVLVRADGDSSPTPPAVPGLETRTVDAGEVDVKIEPRRLDERGAVFMVTLDTHSVELSTDLARTSALEVGGEAWTGAAWTGDPPDGHHRSGELAFEPSGPATGTVRLSIDGFDQPVEATWTLEG